MKRTILIASAVIMVILICCYAIALCEGAEDKHERLDRYSQTRRIYAGLSINEGVACCTGRVTPNSTQSCSLTVRLYKKNGSTWDVVRTWTASATGGQSAYLCRYVSVGYGTYKVVSTGNVAGEITTATSSIVMY